MLRRFARVRTLGGLSGWESLNVIRNVEKPIWLVSGATVDPPCHTVHKLTYGRGRHKRKLKMDRPRFYIYPVQEILRQRVQTIVDIVKVPPLLSVISYVDHRLQPLCHGVQTIDLEGLKPSLGFQCFQRFQGVRVPCPALKRDRLCVYPVTLPFITGVSIGGIHRVS